MQKILKCSFFLATAALIFAGEAVQAHTNFRVLVFSKTMGFRHDSIPDGIAAIKNLGAQHHYEVDATEDAGVFTSGILKQYQAVVFLSTTGKTLSDDQMSGLQAYIRSGGGFVGIHAASDARDNGPWYGSLVGAFFSGHPAGIRPARLTVEDQSHPSTSELPVLWSRSDEWYNFLTNPSKDVHVLVSSDEKSYLTEAEQNDNTDNADNHKHMGYYHPVSWCQDFEGGRSWYTAAGHTSESFAEKEFLDHLQGGIEWAAGVEDGDCGASLDKNFATVVLDTDLVAPMELAVSPDGRIIYIERAGKVKMWDPATQTPREIGQVPNSYNNEDGLLGVTLDPGFIENGWIYFFYSPKEESIQRLSRITLRDGKLDPSSETSVLEFKTNRDACCHAGGSLAFGPEIPGEGFPLFISTGDNTTPFESDSYAPIDEREGRNAFDAQKSSGNASDLRGKILRIIPLSQGGYKIPSGNLFPIAQPKDCKLGCPEVYAMGARNPFRLSVDRASAVVYWGEVGPDAFIDNPNRGARGFDEINRVAAPGNFGWPYAIGENLAYNDYDFATKLSGSKFDLNHLYNDSPNNVDNYGAPGLRDLPPAVPAWIAYTYDDAFDPAPGFYNKIDGRTAMAGPVFHGAPSHGSTAMPKYFENKLFIYDWTRKWIKTVIQDADGKILKINPFLDSFTWLKPIDMEVGSDGHIYILEWGKGWDATAKNGARLVRLDYIGKGEKPPTAAIGVDRTSGKAPLVVRLTAETSSDPNEVSFSWDIENDGTEDATGSTLAHVFREAGDHLVRLTVSKKSNPSLKASAVTTVTVGNTAPDVKFNLPVDGGFFEFGDRIKYSASVTDAEDSGIDFSRIEVQVLLGHDTHAHPQTTYNGSSGIVETQGGGGHDVQSNIYMVLEARYTDNGAPGSRPLHGVKQVALQPKHRQAEHFELHGPFATAGDDAEPKADAKEPDVFTKVVTGVLNGHWMNLAPVSLRKVDQIGMRLKPKSKGTIEFHLDSLTGPEAAAPLSIDTNGGRWVEYFTPVTTNDRTGGHSLYIVFRSSDANAEIADINWVDFDGMGVTYVPRPPRGPRDLDLPPLHKEN